MAIARLPNGALVLSRPTAVEGLRTTSDGGLIFTRDLLAEIVAHLRAEVDAYPDVPAARDALTAFRSLLNDCSDEEVQP